MGLFSLQSTSSHPAKPAAPTTGERRRARDPQAGLSIVAHDLRITGDLQADGVIRIEGRVLGNVQAGDQVLVCAGGVIEGDVITREAVIGGQVSGCIAAEERVELQASALVHGDIATRRLLIQEGGRVNGVVRMEGVDAETLAEGLRLAVNG
ncbi:MAG TPA: polymer-forming cytoskeletal protein [Gemmatimonadales bacterium]|jgi:cytoskeletal protein CcmA (bactofilin family)|nr:polymer-forming cytoskeletal protein [Gemmatimonadales bacterium]